MRGPRSLPEILLASVCCLWAPAQASDTAGVPPTLHWPEGVFRWYYSGAQEPRWLAPGEGEALFRGAADRWAVCGVRLEFQGTTDQPANSADGVNVAGWSASLPPRFRGITLKRRDGDALLEADVVISSANPQLRDSPELLRKVVLHEFGHALGLLHSADCGDVMSFGAYCRVSATDLPEKPAPGDLAQCSKRYSGFREVK